MTQSTRQVLSPSPSSSPLVSDAIALGGGDDGDGVFKPATAPESEPFGVRYAATSPVTFTLNQHTRRSRSEGHVDRLVHSGPLRGLRPYHADSKKDGYRDLLIWMSVVGYLEANEDRAVHFVSSNTSDFFRFADGRWIVHDDLERDLLLRELRLDSVRCHISLADFVRDVVVPHRQVSDRMRREVFEPVLASHAEQCVREIQPGDRLIYEAGSSFDVIERRVRIDRPPQLVRAEVHAVFTPDGTNYVARAYVDFAIDEALHQIHHVKFRLRQRSDGAVVREEIAECPDDPVRFGPGDNERCRARTMWSRPWW